MAPLFHRLPKLFKQLESSASVPGDEAETVKTVVGELLADPDVSRCLLKVWAAFPEPSASSRAALEDRAKLPKGAAAKIKDSEKKAANELGRDLNLNEETTLELIRSCLAADIFLESTGAATSAAKTRSTKTFSDQDKLNVITYYFEQRGLLLRCLSQIVRITLSPSNVLHQQCNEFLTAKLIGQTTNLLDEVLKMYSKIAAETLPSYFANNETLMLLWTRQNLQEQALVLELIFVLLYEKLPATWAQLVKLTEVFADNMFGQRTQAALLATDRESQRYLRSNRIMCVFVVLNAMRLETFMYDPDDCMEMNDDSDSMTSLLEERQAATNPTGSIDGIPLVVNKTAFSAMCKCVNWLAKEPQLCTLASPILIAWACILSQTEKASHLRCAHAYAHVDETNALELMAFAYNNGGFDTLGAMIGEPWLQNECSIFKSICKGLLLLFMTVNRLDECPKPVQVKVSQFFCSIFRNEENLCYQFWVEDYGRPMRRIFLDMAQSDFPFDPFLIELLVSLSGEPATGGDSILYVRGYLDNIGTFSDWLPKGKLDGKSLQITTSGNGVPDRVHVIHPQGWNFQHRAAPGAQFHLPNESQGVIVRSSDTGIQIKWSAPFTAINFLLRVLQAQLNGSPATLDPVWLAGIMDLLNNFLVADGQSDRAMLQWLFPNSDPAAVVSALLSSVMGLVRISAGNLIQTLAEPFKTLLIASIRCVNQLVRMDQTGAALGLIVSNQLVVAPPSSAGAVVASPGLLTHILEHIEQSSSSYPVTKAAVELVSIALLQQQPLEKLAAGTKEELDENEQMLANGRRELEAAVSYLLHSVFSPCHTWRFERLVDRFLVTSQILKACNQLLDLAPRTDGLSPGRITLERIHTPAVLEALFSAICVGPDYLNDLIRKNNADAAHAAEETVLAGMSMFTKLLVSLNRANPEEALPLILAERPGLFGVIASYHRYLHRDDLQCASFRALALLSRVMNVQQQKPLSLVSHLGASESTLLCENIARILKVCADSKEQLVRSHELLMSVLNFLSAALPSQPGLTAALLGISTTHVDPSKKTASASLVAPAKSDFIVAIPKLLAMENLPFPVHEALLRTLGLLWLAGEDLPDVLKDFRSKDFWVSLIKPLRTFDAKASAHDDAVDLSEQFAISSHCLRVITQELVMGPRVTETILPVLKEIKVPLLFGNICATMGFLKEHIRALGALPKKLERYSRMFSLAEAESSPQLPSLSDYSWSRELFKHCNKDASTADLEKCNGLKSLVDALATFTSCWREMLAVSSLPEKDPLWWPSANEVTEAIVATLEELDSIHPSGVAINLGTQRIKYALSELLLDVVLALHRLPGGESEEAAKKKGLVRSTAERIVDLLRKPSTSVSAVGIDKSGYPVCDGCVTLWLRALVLLTTPPTKYSKTAAVSLSSSSTQALLHITSQTVTSLIDATRSLKSPPAATAHGKPFSLVALGFFERLLRLPDSSAFIASFVCSSQGTELLRGLHGMLQLSLVWTAAQVQGVYACDHAVACMSVLMAILQGRIDAGVSRQLVQIFAGLEVGSLLCFNDCMTLFRQLPATVPLQRQDLVDVVLVSMQLQTQMLTALRPSAPPPAFLSQVVVFASMLEASQRQEVLLRANYFPVGMSKLDPATADADLQRLQRMSIVISFYRALAHYWHHTGRTSGNFLPDSVERTIAQLLKLHVQRYLPVLRNWTLSLKYNLHPSDVSDGSGGFSESNSLSLSMTSTFMSNSSTSSTATTISTGSSSSSSTSSSIKKLIQAFDTAVTLLLDTLYLVAPPFRSNLATIAPEMQHLTAPLIVEGDLLGSLGDVHTFFTQRLLECSDGDTAKKVLGKLESVVVLWVTALKLLEQERALAGLAPQQQQQQEQQQAQWNEFISQGAEDLKGSLKSLSEKALQRNLLGDNKDVEGSIEFSRVIAAQLPWSR